MEHTIKLFVGRSKHELGRDTYYQASLSAADIEACHNAACTDIALNWEDCFCEDYYLSKKQKEALLKIPGMENMLEDEDGCYMADDYSWSDIYLQVAKYGARLLGKELFFEEIPAQEIDAGGEVWGYVQ